MPLVKTRAFLAGLSLSFLAPLVTAHAATSVGRVEDAFTHEPVVGAEVVVLSGAKEASAGKTAGDGSFAVPVEPGATRQIRVRADGFAESLVDFTSDNITISLYRGVPIRGVVLSGGKPVAGASVTCRPGVLRETVPVMTGNAGRFHLACPAGHVHLVARAPGKGAEVAHLSLKVEGESDSTIIELGEPVILEGRVLDKGKPVAGADVLGYPNDAYLNDMPTVGTITDKNGRFKLEAMTAGTLKLAAFSNYRVGVVTAIDAPPGSKPAPVDISLEPDLPVDIRVTVGGAVVPETEVTMSCNQPAKRESQLAGHYHRLLEERAGPQPRYLEWKASTDRLGVARFSTRLKGICYVAVNGTAGRGGIAVESTNRDASLELLPAATLGHIKGKFVIKGEPFAGEFSAGEISVTAHGAEKSETSYVWSMVNADGTFEIRNVVPGRYSLSSSARNFTSSIANVVVEVGKTATADVEVIRRSQTSGRVVDAKARKPLSRVSYVVSAESKDRSRIMIPARLTDAEGRFSIEGINGSTVIVFYKEGYRPKTLSIEVPLGGEVDFGQIAMEAGAAASSATIELDKLVVGEGLSKDSAAYLLRKNALEADSCYQRALLTKPDQKGSLKIVYVLKPEYAFSLDVKVKDSTTKSLDLDNCILDRLRGIEFGKPSAGAQAIVEVPIRFGP
jgi:hypothetical protein